MKVAIIGAGKMGRWFTRFFLEQGDSVVVASRSEEKLLKLRERLGIEIASSVDAVKKTEKVLICVPIESFEDVLREIGPHVRPDQIIMDICSIKDEPVKIMHEYIKDGLTLGTHPMFGPGARSIESQNFVLTPTDEKEKLVAEDFKRWLEERGAKVFMMSPRRHDELMSVVLGLPHFLGLVVCDALLDYDDLLETERIAGASYRLLLTLAEAVACEEAEFYASLQTTLPRVEKIEGLFLEKCNKWFDVVRRKDKIAFADKMKLVKRKLGQVKPDYAKSYELVHRLLEIVKS